MPSIYFISQLLRMAKNTLVGWMIFYLSTRREFIFEMKCNCQSDELLFLEFHTMFMQRNDSCASAIKKYEKEICAFSILAPLF